MSKLQRKIQFAHSRGVHVFNLHTHLTRINQMCAEYGVVGKPIPKDLKKYGVHVEGEFYPRINLTKREAANLAYHIALTVYKPIELEVVQDSSIKELKGVVTNG